MGETWIVYASPSKNGTIGMGLCGLSRSFERPFYPSKYSHKPPARNAESIDVLINNSIEKTIALNELRKEIQQLRKLRGK
ncbi:MAG: hypothetical protein ACJA2S_003398 [Cyclobacteriaceae bacterium]